MSSVQSLQHDGVDSTQSITSMNNALLGHGTQLLTPKLVKIGKVSSEKVFRAETTTPKKSTRLNYSREQLLDIAKSGILSKCATNLKINPNAPVRDLTNPTSKAPIQLQRQGSLQNIIDRCFKFDPKDKNSKLKKESQPNSIGSYKNQYVPAANPMDREHNGRLSLNKDGAKMLPAREIPPRQLNRFQRDFDSSNRFTDDRKENRNQFLRSRGEDLSNNFAANRQLARNGDNRFNSYNDSRRRGGNEEEEPEWFTNGPTSQHDVIELNGFESQDIAENDSKKESSSKDFSSSEKNGQKLPELEMAKHTLDEEKVKEDFDLDEIFKLEWQRSLTEHNDRSADHDISSSKFAKYFNPGNKMENQRWAQEFENGKSHDFEASEKHLGLNNGDRSHLSNVASTESTSNESHLINILKKARINVDDLMQQQHQSGGLSSVSIKHNAKSAAELEAHLMQGQNSHPVVSQSGEDNNSKDGSLMLLKLLRQSKSGMNGAETPEMKMPQQNMLNEQTLIMQLQQQQHYQQQQMQQHHHHQQQQQQQYHQQQLHQQQMQHQIQQQQQYHQQQQQQSQQYQNPLLSRLFSNARNNSSANKIEANGNKTTNNFNTFLPTSVIRKIVSEKDKYSVSKSVTPENQPRSTQWRDAKDLIANANESIGLKPNQFEFGADSKSNSINSEMNFYRNQIQPSPGPEHLSLYDMQQYGMSWQQKQQHQQHQAPITFNGFNSMLSNHDATKQMYLEENMRKLMQQHQNHEEAFQMNQNGSCKLPNDQSIKMAHFMNRRQTPTNFENDRGQNMNTYEMMAGHANMNQQAFPMQFNQNGAMFDGKRGNPANSVNLLKMIEDEMTKPNASAYPQMPIQKAVYLHEIERQ